jgi:aldose 1-epimerase
LPVRIAAGPVELMCEPMIGGGVQALRWHGQDMLRAASDKALADGSPTGLAEFPLAPFPNRIGHGRFAWQGREIALERPPQGGDHALHGFAWRRPWVVQEASADCLTLVLEAPASSEWPWDVRVRRSFQAFGSGIAFSLDLMGLGPAAMPAGLGFHPYFSARGAILQLNAAQQILATTDLLPERYAQSQMCAALAAGVPVSELGLDHAFCGWDGRAKLTWPSHSVTIEANAALPFVHIYAPQGADFFCVEPVTCMPNAVNWPGPEPTGLQTLQPGQTLRAAMRLGFTANPTRPE